jgi:hypothetical protein
LQSDAFDSASWGKSTAGTSTAPTVVANQLAGPDSAVIADTVNLSATTTAGDYSLVSQAVTVSAGWYTCSVWARSSSVVSNVYLSLAPDGVNYATTVVPVTTTWQRYQVSYNASAGALYCQIGYDTRDTVNQPVSNAAKTIYLAGAQLESNGTVAGSVVTASSYIPTTSTTAARSADSMPVTNPLTKTSFCVSASATGIPWSGASAVAQGILGLNAVAAPNSLNIFQSSSGLIGRFTNATTTTDASGTVSGTGSHRVEFCSDTTASRNTLYFDGSQIFSGAPTGGGFTAQPSTLYLGERGGGNGLLRGYLSNVKLCNGAAFNRCK